MKKRFLIKVLQYFDLESELESHDVVHEEILRSIEFKGTNLWILIFAIVIASVGLNMNSTAVIIGAMLISPLMGPINGIGYSIATFDMILFKKALKSLSFAVLASLVASTTYFALSPLSTAHSELLARTSPTIYDVLIAFFGGLAGIVAISSRLKGNVLPGVAIATALMPPLCTAGYGLATGQFTFFLGAIYLFLINTIFIAIASVWVSQILKYPIRSIVDPKRKKRINQVITVLITIVLLPSIYFGYKLVQEERFTEKANQYVSNVSLFQGNYLLDSKINAKKNSIELIYGGNQFTDNQIKEIHDKSKDFNLSDAKITIQQGLSFTNMDEKNIEAFKLKEEINKLNIALSSVKAERDSMLNGEKTGKSLFEEMQVLFPQVREFEYSRAALYTKNHEEPVPHDIVIVSLIENDVNPDDKVRMERWLKKRLNSEQVKVIFE